MAHPAAILTLIMKILFDHQDQIYSLVYENAKKENIWTHEKGIFYSCNNKGERKKMNLLQYQVLPIFSMIFKKLF